MGFFNKLFGRGGTSKHSGPAQNGQGNASQEPPSLGAGRLDHGVQAHSTTSPQQGVAPQAMPVGHYTRVMDASNVAAGVENHQQHGVSGGGGGGGGGGYMPLPPPTAAPIMAAPAATPASVPQQYVIDPDPQPNFVPPGLQGYQLGGQTPPSSFLPDSPSIHDDVPAVVNDAARLPPLHADAVPPPAVAAGYKALSVTVPSTPKSLASSSSSFMSRVEEVPSTVVCDRGEMDAKSPWIHEVRRMIAEEEFETASSMGDSFTTLGRSTRPTPRRGAKRDASWPAMLVSPPLPTSKSSSDLHDVGSQQNWSRSLGRLKEDRAASSEEHSEMSGGRSALPRSKSYDASPPSSSGKAVMIPGLQDAIAADVDGPGSRGETDYFFDTIPQDAAAPQYNAGHSLAMENGIGSHSSSNNIKSSSTVSNGVNGSGYSINHTATTAPVPSPPAHAAPLATSSYEEHGDHHRIGTATTPTTTSTTTTSITTASAQGSLAPQATAPPQPLAPAPQAPPPPSRFSLSAQSHHAPPVAPYTPPAPITPAPPSSAPPAAQQPDQFFVTPPPSSLYHSPDPATPPSAAPQQHSPPKPDPPAAAPAPQPAPAPAPLQPTPPPVQPTPPPQQQQHPSHAHAQSQSAAQAPTWDPAPAAAPPAAAGSLQSQLLAGSGSQESLGDSASMRDIPTPHLQGGGKGGGLAGALMEGVLAKLLKKKKEWEDKYCAVACRSRETVTGDGEGVDFAYVLEVHESLADAESGTPAAERLFIKDATVSYVQGTVFTVKTTGEINKKAATHFFSTNSTDEARSWLEALELVEDVTVNWVGKDGTSLKE